MLKGTCLILQQQSIKSSFLALYWDYFFVGNFAESLLKGLRGRLLKGALKNPPFYGQKFPVNSFVLILVPEKRLAILNSL